MAKQRKKVPIFKSEDEEREFWARHDSTDYIDYKKAKRVQVSESEAFESGDLHPFTGVLDREHQGPRKPGRRSLSVDDESSLGGKGH